MQINPVASSQTRSALSTTKAYPWLVSQAPPRGAVPWTSWDLLPGNHNSQDKSYTLPEGRLRYISKAQGTELLAAFYLRANLMYRIWVATKQAMVPS